MKKIQNILLSLATGLSAMCLVSCSDFLEEYSQDTDYVRTWKDLDELLIGDCYLPVHASDYLSYTSTPGSWIHLLGDEVQESQTGYTNQYATGDYREKSFGYFTWQQRVGQNESYTDYYAENDTWTKIYYCINIANNILASVEDVPCVTEVEKEGVHKVRGEAHFLRAYYFFWLANLYGKPYNPATAETDLCVPLKTSDVVEDKKFTRQSVAEVYRQVLADLSIAESELGQLKNAKLSIYRADSTACHLLQSRVYLYMQQWDKASLYAKKVMAAHPALTNLNTATGKFLVKDNVENIFSSKELYDAYSSSDLRKSQWYWKKGLFVGPVRVTQNNMYLSYDVSDANYYERAYSEKGKQEEVSGQFLMRSAEAYLNEAEAEAYLGKEDEARRVLNLLRGNRISASSNSAVTASGAELITFIRNERRRELALEGHRWFDLRRYMVCSVLPESNAITHEWTYYSSHTSTTMTERRRFVLEANDDAYTLPIPQEVINFNTGMPNNARPWRKYTVVQ